MPAWGIYQISRQESPFYKLHIQSEQIPPLFAPEKIPCGKNRFTSNQLYFYMMKEINYRIFNNRYLMPQQTAEKKHRASDDKMQKPPDETGWPNAPGTTSTNIGTHAPAAVTIPSAINGAIP